MFGKKKNEESQTAASRHSDVRVHTMADDLTGNSDVTAPSQSDMVREHSIAQSPQTESPFLQSVPTPPVPSNAQSQGAVKSTVPQHAPTSTKNTADTVIEKNVIGKNGGGGVITIVLLVLFFGLLVAIGWFAWKAGLFERIISSFSASKTQVVTQDIQANATQDASAVANQADAGRSVQVDRSAVLHDRDTRFVSADATITVSSQATMPDIIAAIKTTATQVNRDIATFDIVDDTGTPLSLAIFAKRFLPTVPVALLTTLNQPVQVYVMRQAGQQRIGLHTYTDQPDQMRNNLRTFETSLVTGLAPLFLFAPQPAQAVVFDDSAYKGVPIRFYNFVPNATQSVDYAIHYEHVFLGTSRMTMHMMMDRVFTHDDEMMQSQQNAAAVQIAPATGPDPAAATPGASDNSGTNRVSIPDTSAGGN